jgi:hypothetical protein
MYVSNPKNMAPSLIILVLVNIIPIYGILIFNWPPMDVIYLYWAETAIIGVFNIFKMATSSHNIGLAATKDKVYNITFFIVHFGVFILAQGLFFMSMDPSFKDNFDSFDVLIKNLWWPFLFLCCSHLFSFFYNYIGKKEYKKYAASDLMLKPYGRVFLQQFLVILGALIFLHLENRNIIVMLLLVAAKIIADAYAHYREHRVKKEDETASVDTI